MFGKFAPEGRSPSPLRRVLNVVTSFFFMDITRKLGPLLEGTSPRIVHREPAFLGRAFEIVLLEKR